MLGGKEQHGAVEDHHVVEASLFGRFPLVVDDAGAGEVMVLPTTFHEPPTQIDVLTVHEELLVEQAHLIQGLLPHPHERPRQDVHGGRFCLPDVPCVIRVERLRCRGQTVHPRHAAKRRPRRGKSALGFGQETTRPIVHRNAHAAQFGVAVRMREAGFERVFSNDSVGIQQDHMPPGAGPNGLVVGHGEPHVVFVGHEVHPGKTVPNHVHRTIDAAVVHHPHVNRHPVHGTLDGHQALLEEGPNVVTDDDDTQIGHPLYGNRFNKELDNVASSAY